MLFHISDRNDIQYLTPRIPRVAPGIKEDNTTPRICFAPSINCCLRAICLDTLPFHLPLNVYNPENSSLIGLDEHLEIVEKASEFNVSSLILKNQISLMENEGLTLYPLYHAYIPIDVKYNEVYVPTENEVFDVSQTHEVWVKRPCRVERVFSFFVTGSFSVGEWKYIDGNGVERTSTVEDYLYMIISNEIADLIKKQSKLSDKEFIKYAELKKELSKIVSNKHTIVQCTPCNIKL